MLTTGANSGQHSRFSSSNKGRKFNLGSGLNSAGMTVDDVEFEAELVFQRDSYFVLVRETKGVTLSIEVERRNDGCRWRGDFTSRYIEEITQRVGNLKNFKTFVEMLKCAILRKSTSLHVELLTYHDLEKLTLSRGADDSRSTLSCRALTTDKRYLILTYITEFDRVHYPLPLMYEEDAEPAALKRSIQRLRNELDYMKAQVRKSEATPDSPEIAAKNSDQESNISHGNSGIEGGRIDRRGCTLDDVTAYKRTIMKLMKKNSMLMDELKRAKEAEQRMSIKLQDQAFEIGLLKKRLSMRGVRDVSPAAYRDVSPIRGRPRLPPQSPSTSRPRLSKSPSLGSRNSSVPRRLHSPSLSPMPGSGSPSCPRFRPKCRSAESSPREKPQLHPTPFLTSARDLVKDKTSLPPSIRIPRSFSSSFSESRENFRAKLLTHRRAEGDRADKSIRKNPRSMHAMSLEVEEIDSRLYALCNFLKSSQSK